MEQRCLAGPDTYKPGGTDQQYEDQRNPGCRSHEMVETRTLRRGNKANSKTTLDFLRAKFVHRSAWKNSMGYGLGERRSPGKLVDV